MATGTESALLQPASIREIGAFLATLPSRPRLTWWALLIGNFAVALTAMVVTSSAIGALVDIINGIERFPFGTGQRAFWLMIVVIATGLFLDTVGRAYGQYNRELASPTAERRCSSLMLGIGSARAYPRHCRAGNRKRDYSVDQRH